MGFKNFFISITKSLIVLIVATLIFSSVTLDFPDLIKGLFGDIFTYASPDAQKQVISNLAETCSSLNQQSNSLTPNLGNIGAVCKDYKDGKINDREFFFNVIGNSLPSNMETPQIVFFDKYNKAITYLNSNKMIYFLILIVLIVVLYLLIMDLKLFILTLSGISFSIGIIIILPYFAILAYEKFIGFDTTPILSNIFGAGNVFDFKAITSVILLLFLRTYDNFIIIIGIVFLIVGIAGKFYSWKLKKQGRKAETKIEKKSEEGAKKLKEAKKDKKEIDEETYKKDRERKRDTKEILDELEEMHRKRVREKDKES